MACQGSNGTCTCKKLGWPADDIVLNTDIHSLTDVDALNSVLRWVEARARSVLFDLMGQAKEPLPLADVATLPSEKSWMKVRISTARSGIPLLTIHL